MHSALKSLEPVFQTKPDALGAYHVTAALSRHLAPHRMSVEKGGALRTDLRQLDLGAVSLFYLHYGTGVVIDVDRVDDYLIHYALAGTGTLEVDGLKYDTPPGSLFVTSPGAHPVKRMTADCAHLIVRLDAETVRSHVRASLNMSIDETIRFTTHVDGQSAWPRAWINLVLHICQQTSSLRELRNGDALRERYSGMLIELLIGNQPSNYTLASGGGTLGALPWYVRKALDVIDDRFRNEVTVAEIANDVGVSVRTLQVGFQRFVGATPANFLRNKRLDCLHQRLVDPASMATVTDLMLDCGIPHLSRYAEFYRSRFGCSPSDTIKRHRVLRASRPGKRSCAN